MADTINNTDDMIDVRDIISRIEELEGELEGFEVKGGCEFDELTEELEMLTSFMDSLKNEGGGDERWNGDWYPLTLIRDSYFTEAMQELCEDIGDMPRDGFPSYMVIDWEATARNLRMDYTSCEF
jgi:hypothetical protein